MRETELEKDEEIKQCEEALKNREEELRIQEKQLKKRKKKYVTSFYCTQ
jgi:phosphoribosyl-dephospho-CoA transferase